MRKKPDNNKEGFKGYALEDQLHEYEDGESPLVLHDSLACLNLRMTQTITVWADNIDKDNAQPVYLHTGCI